MRSPDFTGSVKAGWRGGAGIYDYKFDIKRLTRDKPSTTIYVCLDVINDLLFPVVHSGKVVAEPDTDVVACVHIFEFIFRERVDD